VDLFIFFLLNHDIFCSCSFSLDVGYFFCSLSLLLYYQLFPRDSPPNTPQRHRNAERVRERQGRILESPEHRRTPQIPAVGGGIPFVPFALPFPIPPPVAPLQIPPPPVGDDPFVEVQYNGHVLQLTPGLAAQVGNLLLLQNQVGCRVLSFFKRINRYFRLLLPPLPSLLHCHLLLWQMRYLKKPLGYFISI
jgi:hypothetical protein